MGFSKVVQLNPVKGDVSDSHLNAGGGGFDHPLLLKVILKPIEIMITCKKSGHYLKNSPRY